MLVERVRLVVCVGGVGGGGVYVGGEQGEWEWVCVCSMRVCGTCVCV